ncbi:uncharacterized protein SPPG_02499 [Spizellomyces punctatus DAOM BR117]|uniref:DUF4200 domain-containing protein n=1 Tax=Spizellomyces punctatus (strain DAOM BR117) TaxID=645134 RepID=A0A0L0HLQ7_SPIPD|nr:uncharacterized protein SPPG_02499 [Spizellomyces punctatus DAOM BR117]KND01993.1 hypothetical protein SPPG_02499 [Spizellomyces punctatus DAOM BR117]|eukprot:XP_016610032.1 hypothetical protein SPPG_02499 [Spizellomyces punctatus DAOM BR117]
MTSKHGSRTAKKPPPKKQKLLSELLTVPRNAKQRALMETAQEESDYEEEEPLPGKDDSQSQGLSDLLGLFQAQFKKKNAQRTKKAESEHDAKLQMTVEQMKNYIAEREEERDDKIEGRKRKYEETWEHQATTMTAFTTDYERVLKGWAAIIDLLDTHHTGTFKARQEFHMDMDEQTKSHAVQAAHQFTIIQKQIHAAKKEAQELIKESYDTSHIRKAIQLLLNA